jgi:hypothetical protein
VKWPNDIIGNSRLLQQNRHLADTDDLVNDRFAPTADVHKLGVMEYRREPARREHFDYSAR